MTTGTCCRLKELEYEGAIFDCHALVDRFAKSVMRTRDAAAAWWLCANWASRINCYTAASRNLLIDLAAEEASPPSKEPMTWRQWFDREEVAADRPVDV